MTDNDFDDEETTAELRKRLEIRLIEAYEAKVKMYGEDTDLWPDEDVDDFDQSLIECPVCGLLIEPDQEICSKYLYGQFAPDECVVSGREWKVDKPNRPQADTGDD